MFGSAVSFLKTPPIPRGRSKNFRARYPELPGFDIVDDKVKVPLGWILDHVLRVRGVRDGNVGTYEGQALVVVAYENATAEEIGEFANKIIARIKAECAVDVEWEVTKLST